MVFLDVFIWIGKDQKYVRKYRCKNTFVDKVKLKYDEEYIYLGWLLGKKKSQWKCYFVWIAFIKEKIYDIKMYCRINTNLINYFLCKAQALVIHTEQNTKKCQYIWKIIIYWSSLDGYNVKWAK